MNSIKLNVFDNLVNAAEQWPENIAVFDDQGGITFSELLAQTNQLKEFLKTHNIPEQASLAIMFKNNRNFIVSLYAGIGCGCVVMPLATYQKDEEIERAIQEAGIHFILSEINTEKFGTTSVLNFNGQEFYLTRTDNSLTQLASHKFPDAVVMRFTSGTTSDAKCVVLSHQTVFERTQAANEGLQLTHNDRVVWVLPMAFHFVVSIMLYVRYGAGIIICYDFLGENILKKISACNGTMLYASPMHIRLLSSVKENISAPSLKKVLSTTAGISPAICKTFEDKFNIPVSQAFGIIEVGLPIINTQRAHENPEAVGYGLPSFTVSIVDDEQKELAENTLGMLAIKGPGIFDGYLTPYKSRKDVLKNGWFLTGDLATKTSEGLIEIKGRSKNVINVSGNKVFPNEVEDVLNLYTGITATKVYGKSHPLLGEMVVADVTLKRDFELDIEEVINYCREHLSSYKVPQRINIVEHIEMTGSGKVKRN